MAVAAALTEAIARLDGRFGARTVTTATVAADRGADRRFLTETPFDRLSGGIAAGSAVALVGEGTCGKVTLAMRAVDASGRQHEALAINEVSLLRQTKQAAKIRVWLNGKPKIEELVCDGVMLATPRAGFALSSSRRSFERTPSIPSVSSED